MEKERYDQEQHEQPESESPAAAQDLEERIKQLEQALAQKEAESAANWEKVLRERADLENYRRRVQKEKEDLVRYGNENLISEILPSVDNLERAMAHVSEDDCKSPVIEGVKMTLSMLQSSLKKFGVTPIEAKGVPFDSAIHHAMGQVERGDLPPNTVVDELQKGYMLNDRLLRPAMVTVSVPLQAGKE